MVNAAGISSITKENKHSISTEDKNIVTKEDKKNVTTEDKISVTTEEKNTPNCLKKTLHVEENDGPYSTASSHPIIQSPPPR